MVSPSAPIPLNPTNHWWRQKDPRLPWSTLYLGTAGTPSLHTAPALSFRACDRAKDSAGLAFGGSVTVGTTSSCQLQNRGAPVASRPSAATCSEGFPLPGSNHGSSAEVGSAVYLSPCPCCPRCHFFRTISSTQLSTAPITATQSRRPGACPQLLHNPTRVTRHCKAQPRVPTAAPRSAHRTRAQTSACLLRRVLKRRSSEERAAQAL